MLRPSRIPAARGFQIMPLARFPALGNHALKRFVAFAKQPFVLIFDPLFLPLNVVIERGQDIIRIGTLFHKLRRYSWNRVMALPHAALNAFLTSAKRAK